MAALRWDDIDVLHRTVHIAKKVIEVTGHGLLECSTKTKAGRRTVTVPRLVLEEIERHREHFASGRRLLPHPKEGSCKRTTCGAAVGRVPSKWQDWRRRPSTTMRHTAVPSWIAVGATALEAAKWVGHRSVSFIKDPRPPATAIKRQPMRGSAGRDLGQAPFDFLLFD